MPKYEMCVTRDVTESTFFTVRADSEDEAREKAMEFAMAAERFNHPQLRYERDQCATSDPYITGCDEMDESPLEQLAAQAEGADDA